MSALPERADRRVLIVEDHRLFAEAVDLALSVEGYAVHRIEVPPDPGSPGALVTEIVKQQPLVVLLDLDLGGFGDGVRLIEPIARSGANVIVVTGSTDRARWGDAVQAGARKVLSKSQPLSDILATVRRIIAGLPVMDREEREELVSEWTRFREELHEVRERLEQLTNREGVVLGHLMKGRAVRQIAGMSTVSEATVRTQVKSILAKLEVSSQLAAVGMAHEIGWQAPVA
jgi:two-component system, NarL family, nitrate/nitrite response regulator NarL